MPKNLIHFSKQDYEIIKREILYQGVFPFVRYHLRHRLFNGNWSHIIYRELLERKTAVGILPYDPILDRVVLIEQFRPGAIANPHTPWLIEITAGMLDTNEKPADVATREAREEADCVILDLFRICEYFASPGGSNEYLYLYCGRVDASNINGIYGLQAENEDIYAFTLSTEEAFRLVQEGKIKTAHTIIALQWLQLNQERLKQLWQIKLSQK
jgi:ADP-ribose pyrophosphatase